MFFLLSSNALAFLLEALPNDFFKPIDFIFEIFTDGVDLVDFYNHFSFLLFCLKCLSHTIGDWRLIESLICLNSHFDFITDTNQEETTFSTVNRHLPDEFIKGLWVKFFSDGTNTCLTCLSLLQLFVKFILKTDNIDTCSWCWWNVLDPQLSAVLIFTRWQYRI